MEVEEFLDSTIRIVSRYFKQDLNSNQLSEVKRFFDGEFTHITLLPDDVEKDFKALDTANYWPERSFYFLVIENEMEYHVRISDWSIISSQLCIIFLRNILLLI